MYILIVCIIIAALAATLAAPVKRWHNHIKTHALLQTIYESTGHDGATCSLALHISDFCTDLYSGVRQGYRGLTKGLVNADIHEIRRAERLINKYLKAVRNNRTHAAALKEYSIRLGLPNPDSILMFNESADVMLMSMWRACSETKDYICNDGTAISISITKSIRGICDKTTNAIGRGIALIPGKHHNGYELLIADCEALSHEISDTVWTLPQLLPKREMHIVGCFLQASRLLVVAYKLSLKTMSELNNSNHITCNDNTNRNFDSLYHGIDGTGNLCPTSHR